LLRDGSACVICESKVSIEAAHIIPVSSIEPLSDFGLLDKFSVENGVAMCRDCHFAFDQHLIGFDPDQDVITVCGALQCCELYNGRWSDVHGKRVRKPSTEVAVKHWPPKKAWQYQLKKFQHKAEERQKLASSLVHFCDVCKLFWAKSTGGLQLHQKSQKCFNLKSLSAESLSRMTKLRTPLPEAQGGGGYGSDGRTVNSGTSVNLIGALGSDEVDDGLGGEL